MRPVLAVRAASATEPDHKAYPADYDAAEAILHQAGLECGRVTHAGFVGRDVLRVECDHGRTGFDVDLRQRTARNLDSFTR